MCVTIRVGRLTWLTTGSTRVSRILGRLGQKLTRTDICTKCQPNPAQIHDEPNWPTDSDPL